MNKFSFASVAVLAGALAAAGCSAKPAHPDEKTPVQNAFSTNDLTQLSVSQNRDTGVMTITGEVASADLKAKAESLAKQAAPGYTIADDITVQPQSAQNVDTAIESHFKASLKAHRRLDRQHINYSAKNRTLVLKGMVRTSAEKAEAGKAGESYAAGGARCQ